jgi:pSer/pThr/pTyr-binding forkhead associated (FHA) protein
MAKILLATENVMLREITLVKGCITIGRAPQNDIVIDDRAISARHVIIVTVDGDSFLEDLNSTNGTLINGQPVKKHFFQDGDVVELAGYQMRYLANLPSGAEVPQSVVISSSHVYLRDGGASAKIKIISGPNVGKEVALGKAMTTFGCPGVKTVAIVKQFQSYYLTCIEGTGALTMNGKLMQNEEIPMINGDIIELCGVRMQFLGDLFADFSRESVNTLPKIDNNLSRGD